MEKTTILFVQTPAAEGRLLLCRWVEAFTDAGRRVQVAVESSVAAHNIDGLLWTFADESFVPHAVLAPGKGMEERVEPVVISIGEVFLPGFHVLVNDIGEPDLDFLLRYPVGVQFVLQDDADQRQQSRLLWMAARDRGAVLHHVPHPAVPREILRSLSF